jgi:NarL family two-component system response regulator LiaR
VILAESADETLTFEVLKAGAISYLLKTGTINEVATAIRAAYDGKSTLAPEAVAALISVSRHKEKFGSTLTIREREVLAFMVNGLNNIRIAEALAISRSTVKNHISNIFSKLAVGSRTKVVAMAVQHKLYATA